MTLSGNLGVEAVARIEELAHHAWPGLVREAWHGWEVRYAHGITRRANSVWPNQAQDDLPLEQTLAAVEAFYHGHNLPARFQICPAAQPAGLDEALAARGYRAVARTAVQTARASVLQDALTRTPALRVEVAPEPDATWWRCYAEADDVAPESVAVRQRICAAIQPPAAYASVVENGEVIAVGSAVQEAGWVGFFNVATLPAQRRKGAARALMAALAMWGVEQGAGNAYLQVMANNSAALGLYSGLGFATAYFYHYREEVRS